MKFFTPFLILLCITCYGQKVQEPKKESSSYSKLKKRSVEVDVDDQIDRAYRLRSTNPQQSLDLVKDALALSILQQDKLAESRCYNLLGAINQDIQEWKLARENFLSARNTLAGEKILNVAEYKTALKGLANSSLKLNAFEEALSYYNELKTLKLSQSENADVELGISEVYFQMGKYQDALNTLDDASSKGAAPATEGRYDNQRAKILARDNKIEESQRKLSPSQNKPQPSAASEKAVDKEYQSAKDEIVDVLEEQKRYDEKIEVLSNSIEYNRGAQNLGEVSKDKLELGKTFLAKGETSNAIRELEEAAAIADTIDDPSKQAEAYLSLAELHERYGNNIQAIQTYKKYSKAINNSQLKSETEVSEKAGLLKTQRDIEEVSKYVTISKQEEQLAQATVSTQKLVIYGLLLIIAIIATTSYFIYKNALASKTANQMLALKSLRSQMNPHFIFNALNSVNHFVSQNDERTANKFLAEFSRLMRLVLENSQEDFIPLAKEEEIISLYLKLEHYRFRDKFDFEITLDEEINKEGISIPPMLIQPYIENAVWHGLRYKESKGFLSVRFIQQGADLLVEIADNGIGRKKSAALKTDNQKKHQSTGLKNIRERLAIINKVYKQNYRVTIDDLVDDTGTKVTLFIPVDVKISSYA